MNTTTTIRRGIASTAAAAAFFAFAACGSEISAPTQDIGGTIEKNKKDPAPPTNTSGSRKQFGDEYGSPDRRKETAKPWKGTRNRIDFRDGGI